MKIPAAKTLQKNHFLDFHVFYFILCNRKLDMSMKVVLIYYRLSSYVILVRYAGYKLLNISELHQMSLLQFNSNLLIIWKLQLKTFSDRNLKLHLLSLVIATFLHSHILPLPAVKSWQENSNFLKIISSGFVEDKSNNTWYICWNIYPITIWEKQKKVLTGFSPPNRLNK